MVPDHNSKAGLCPGWDIMVTQDNRPVFLEINTYPGWPDQPDSLKTMDEAVWSYALDPLMGPTPLCWPATPAVTECWASTEGVPAAGALRDTIKLVDIAPRHRAALERITSQKKTMSMVGNQRPWNKQNVDKFIEYNLADQAKGDERRDYYWGITAGPVLIGVVGIHTDFHKRDAYEGMPFVTRFIDKAYTGQIPPALKQALNFRCKVAGASTLPVYEGIFASNIASRASLKKVGFEQIDDPMFRTPQRHRVIYLHKIDAGDTPADKNVTKLVDLTPGHRAAENGRPVKPWRWWGTCGCGTAGGSTISSGTTSRTKEGGAALLLRIEVGGSSGASWVSTPKRSGGRPGRGT